ncbi:hypothetical protein QYE76_027275 [Lolium multiflorum]|uniref:Arabidopsis retrotransposon Orf1 C-terminal domain-containing protein n=1 Tax=Lolium multiflorum TaxID=4521 RepID=A0AAD8UZ77_LOLMU|nr:hypothetical protein QYE76_027275 [Lolium multiflorum]
MGKTRDTKIAILPSTTRKGTILSTSATLDSPSVIDKLVSPPHASHAGTSAESEHSHNIDNVSAVFDDSGSLGSFLDATIAKSRQIEKNTETPNATTPVSSPELEYSSDDLEEDYVELDDDFIEKCTASRIDDNPRDLLELYRGITNDDCRTIQRGKIRNIQLPAIKYFAYYIATSILGRENTSNISSYHLAFLNIALTGQTSYHLGALIARRLSTRGPIFGGTIALRVLTYLDLPIDPNDVPLAPRRLDIAAMKSHHFVTTESTLDNMAYRMLFADGDEKEIPLPQPGLFDIDRQPWSRTKEEVEEHMKIQEFHQQHDSEDVGTSYDHTVTYPGASSSTYPEYDPSSSYYGDTSWPRWD